MSREKALEKLPKHKDYDHEIPIEKGKKLTYGPTYTLLIIELQALQEHLDENLKEEFIQLSTSPAGYPILFVPKEDGRL